MSEYAVGEMVGRSLDLVIASKNIIIIRYIVKAPRQLILTIFRNIKTLSH